MSSYDLGSEPLSRSSTLSISTQTFSLVNDDSDDEIVFNISSGSHSSGDISTESSLDSDEEDFVVLSRPLSLPSRSATPGPPQLHLSPPPSSDPSELASEFERLCLKTTKNVAAPFVGDSPSPPSTPVGTRLSKNRRRRRVRDEPQAIGLGFRPIVDDISESNFSTDHEPEVSDSFEYEEAVNYVTSFLRNPSEYKSSSRLMLLQSLIVELGLSSSSLPMSLKSAKAVIKSQAFLNIREYLAVRGKGPDAVKQVMYPSRSALIKSIRKQPRSRAPLDWVKEHGLQVLLVTAYHH
ncbi:hypothetical protein GGU10DRAFT_277304 [Lentinula aff. detonsa]|uniref:Uncharacterized protein n=1 Tax=Lentinula aff. detonsa TaxID=2804958 RepID=A0AA38NHR0_9AGAR|nr:hypothetical protein GGU10DRAFT_277304 [Lentinula aff. detonsa]